MTTSPKQGINPTTSERAPIIGTLTTPTIANNTFKQECIIILCTLDLSLTEVFETADFIIFILPEKNSTDKIMGYFHI